MRAIVQDTYGSTEVLKLGEIDPPEVGNDEVLVRVRAAGLDRGVWHMMAGLPLMIRVMGFGFRGPKIRVPGYDFAGRVAAVGKNAKRFEIGEEVFGIGSGSFAEYICAREDRLEPKPTNLSLEQAAAVPTSALTALQGLRDHGKIEAGQKVLIIGASGGVGTFAVQVAKAFGAVVTGVCRTAKVEMVRTIGADHVIDYKHDDFLQRDQRYDLILDIGGNRSLSQLRRVLTPRGTLVIIGGEEGGRWLGGTDRMLRVFLLSPFVRQNLRAFVAKSNKADLQLLKELIESGKVRPVIDRTFPLNEAPEALRYLEEGRARGKVIVTVKTST
jgi:2-desacetyl-2-hydroxyethyl bacteriochlorophyllide A dehydrogenase